MPDLIDTHAHLDDDRLRADRSGVLSRARAAGLVHIVSVATDLASSRACLALAREEALVAATAGIHPNHVAASSPTDWDDVVALVTSAAGSGAVVGIGETGLDRHWDDTPFPRQEEYFARHLELARLSRLPVVIHCREAEPDVLRMLRDEFDRHGPLRGVLHSFTGSAAMRDDCVRMGLHLSFAGMVTYKNAAGLREVAKAVPDDRLLVETDSPYLAPVPVRGKPNEPAYVAHTAACLAGVRGVTLAELADQTTRNARRVFGLPG